MANRCGRIRRPHLTLARSATRPIPSGANPCTARRAVGSNSDKKQARLRGLGELQSVWTSGFSIAQAYSPEWPAGPAQTLHNLHKVGLDTVAVVRYTRLQISSNPRRFFLYNRGSGRNARSLS